ncbi:hypothetical protein D3C87_1973910 [compost metagenome]
MRPVHGPCHGKTIGHAERSINHKAAVIYVRQQMGEVTLDRKQPLMLAERVDEGRIRMIKRRQR